MRHIPIRSGILLMIDHDIFPMKPVTITHLINQRSYYGHLQERGSRWYLWPGYCFFNLDKISIHSLDFLPSSGLDTGGGNWAALFTHSRKPSLLPHHAYARLSDLLALPIKKWEQCQQLRFKPDEQKKLIQSDELVEFINDWIHFFNASNWKKTKDKSKYIDQLLEKVLHYEY
jgi:hypothetical protein